MQKSVDCSPPSPTCFALADQDWIGLAFFNKLANQDWIGFNFIGSGLDSDWKISQSAHLWSLLSTHI